MRVLKGSSHRVLAINPDGQVVGFATAISDGSLNAYISLLEVLPEYRRKGIGTALVQQLLRALGEMYSVALHCDSGVREFYEAIGMQPVGGMVLRNYSVVAADRKSVTPRVREDS